MLKLISIICILSLSFAVQYENQILKEKLETVPSSWSQKESLNQDDQITLHIFIKQQNLEKLEETLYAVSDPRSETYGQHLTFEEVNELVAPKKESIQEVTKWLMHHNISSIHPNVNSDIFQVHTDIKTAELLLSTKFYNFEHGQTNQNQVRALDYSLHEEVHSHIDFIGPCIRFPRIMQSQVVQSSGNDYVTPKALRKLYKTGDTKSKSPNNSQGIASFLGEYMSNSDLQEYFKQYDPENLGVEPIIVGFNNESWPGQEAALDIEYMASMGNGVKDTYFWFTPGNPVESPKNEPFIQWLHDVSNAKKSPLVFSISYGDHESTANQTYNARVAVEFQKAGVRGISILAASGDYGVGCTDKKYDPTWPAECPFVTAVGGTEGGIFTSEEIGTTLSSGGFSNIDTPPKYQKEFIDKYFETAKDFLPNSSYYNSSGAGFPDVSAQAISYAVIWWNITMPASGTSASCPVFAGMVALLNDIRLQAGKPPLGWLNPLLYQHPEAFNDITKGSNLNFGCGGFNATKGWDPVTGLGTMDFEKWSEVIKKLNEKDNEKFLQK